MCVCVCVHSCVHICTYTHTCISFECVCVCVFYFISVYPFVSIYICTDRFVSSYLFDCLYICYVNLLLFLSIYVFIYTYIISLGIQMHYDSSIVAILKRRSGQLPETKTVILATFNWASLEKKNENKNIKKPTNVYHLEILSAGPIGWEGVRGRGKGGGGKEGEGGRGT